jgi:hypothetical protein
MLRRDLILATPLLLAAKEAVAQVFEFTSTKGEHESTAKYRGRSVALYFFIPGCSHCRGVCQILGRIQAQHTGKLQVLGAAYTEDAAQHMADFMMQVAPGYPVGISTRDKVLKWLGGPNDDGKQLPRLVLIDPKGVIRGSYGWQDEIFRDPATEEQKISAAIAKLNGEKRG